MDQGTNLCVVELATCVLVIKQLYHRHTIIMMATGPLSE